MQVMMFAVGLYAGDFQGMEPNMQLFLRWVSFAVTTPVVLYAARPFFRSAWRGVVARAPGMDLPVSIAVTAAYFGIYLYDNHRLTKAPLVRLRRHVRLFPDTWPVPGDARPTSLD